MIFHRFKYPPFESISSHKADNISEDELNDIKHIFRLYDKEQKGYLTKFQYKLAFITLLGFHPSKMELETLFPEEEEENKKESNGITLSRFAKLMRDKLKRIDSIEKNRNIFKVFDRNLHGYLTISDLEYAVDQVLPSKNCKHVLMQAFDAFDSNGDGMITYSDFCEMMNYDHSEQAFCSK
jgi:Ca2+-binding EF-hand superfamily protein